MGSFIKNNIHPPLEFPSNSFDVLISHSVFTHLSEEMFKEWMGEFYPVLKPGGIACFTIRTFHYIQHIQRLIIKDEHHMNSYKKRQKNIFSDIENLWEKYQAGEFIYPEDVNRVPESAAEDDNFFTGYYNSEFYSEAVIPPKYILKNLDQFNLQAFIDIPDFIQAYVTIQKPPASRTPMNKSFIMTFSDKLPDIVIKKIS